MNRLYKVTLFASFVILPFGLMAQETPDVKTLLQGDAVQVEQLVDIGAKSVDEAAGVMESTTRIRPRALIETVLGLALRMDEEVFTAAVSKAMQMLGDNSELQDLLRQAVADANRVAYRDRRDECLSVNLAGFAASTRGPDFAQTARERSLPPGVAVCSGAERIGTDLLASPS